MTPNPITEEIRSTRRKLAEVFSNDIDLIGSNLRAQQIESGRPLVQMPKRIPRQLAHPDITNISLIPLVSAIQNTDSVSG
jgi:hypothetical protein